MTATGDAFLRPAVPADEDQRLAALENLHLLDTEPEEAFDRVTRRLSDIFQAPISLMSLVDRDRQWWKSQQGLPEDVAEAGSTSRDVAVCGHVVGSNETLVVNDLARDARFAENPLVRQLGLRFYAGAPLRTEAGQPVGALCVIDTRPRDISDRERRLLEMIADDVMTEVRLRGLSRRLLELSRQVSLQNRVIEADMAQARAVQRCLLPAEHVESEAWRVSHLYHPAAQIGGDFVDVLVRQDGSIVALVADVLGHGASAALMAAMLKTAFLRNAGSSAEPHDLLTALQRDLEGVSQGDQFITAAAAVLHPAGGSVALASAGHPYPIVQRGGPAGRPAEPTEVAGDLPLLVLPGNRYAESTRLRVETGDRVLLYTDGAFEVRDGGPGVLGMGGLARLVGALNAPHGKALLTELFGRITALAGHQLPDDVALVSIEPK